MTNDDNKANFCMPSIIPKPSRRRKAEKSLFGLSAKFVVWASCLPSFSHNILGRQDASATIVSKPGREPAFRHLSFGFRHFPLPPPLVNCRLIEENNGL